VSRNILSITISYGKRNTQKQNWSDAGKEDLKAVKMKYNRLNGTQKATKKES